MSLVAVTCTCGSVENLVRKHLRLNDCDYFMEVPITKGKDKALSALNTLPQHEKLDELRQYIANASKFAVVVGYNDRACGWADIASGSPKQALDVGVVIKHFK